MLLIDKGDHAFAKMAEDKVYRYWIKLWKAWKHICKTNGIIKRDKMKKTGGNDDSIVYSRWQWIICDWFPMTDKATHIYTRLSKSCKTLNPIISKLDFFFEKEAI